MDSNLFVFLTPEPILYRPGDNVKNYSSITMKISPTTNPLEIADRLQSYFNHITQTWRPTEFYRIEGPGIILATLIFDFMDFADRSNDKVTKEKASKLLAIYASYYERLTMYKFDHTAPRVSGDFWKYLESLEQYESEQGNPSCTCPRCQPLL